MPTYLASYVYDGDGKHGFGNAIIDDPLRTAKEIRAAEKQMREELGSDHVVILNIIELEGEE